MFQFGIDARPAVATNKFALTFMSVGGSLPLLIVLTLLGSAIGAMLLLSVPSKVVPVIVSIAIIGLAVFSMLYWRSGVDVSPLLPNCGLEITGYALTFLLGIYGGLFSGGYVTILTAIFVATFRMTFIEAIASTKLINLFFRRELRP